MKKILIRFLVIAELGVAMAAPFVALAACDKKTEYRNYSKEAIDAAELRLIREPQTGACYVVVAFVNFKSAGIAMAPSSCPPSVRAIVPAEAPAADGGVR